MKILSLILLTFVFFTPEAFAAAPHSLTSDGGPDHRYIIDLLVQKKPVHYKVTAEGELRYDILTSFTSWFSNVLNSMTPVQEKELEPILDILRFGADPANYIQTAEEADISLYFGDTSFRWNLGEFSPKRAVIRVRGVNQDYPKSTTLVHEIGHALRLSDLYRGQYTDTDGRYGSGRHSSIMHDNQALTCDDADAVVNSIYYALKLQNPNQPDLHFSSFCRGSARTYHNARLLNRSPEYVDYEASRTLYQYCDNGSPQSIIKITPRDVQHLYSEILSPVSCPHIKFAPEAPYSYPENHNFSVMDWTTGKLIKTFAGRPERKETFYIPVPNSRGIRAVLVYNDGKIPAYLYVQNEKKQTLYFLAYLQNGYNVVYDSYFNEQKVANPEAGLLCYERNNPANRFFWTKNKTPSEQERQAAEILSNTYELFFQKGILPPKPRWGMPYDFHWNYLQQHLAFAKNWEIFLLQIHTPDAILSQHYIEHLKKNFVHPARQYGRL